MELRGKRLMLTSVGLNSAKALLPAFNGNEQFNVWSGLSEHVSLEEVKKEIQEIQQ